MKIRIKNSNNKKVERPTVFAFGGDIQTNGSDFFTGLSHINEGGLHEENPYQGVQMGVDSNGTPNLVEEGETVFNDYVYSQRILADAQTLKKFHLSPKAKLTFADITKRLEKEIAERPNDPISKASFKKQMEALANEQERQKAEEKAREAQEQFAQMSPEEQVAVMQQLQQAQQEPSMVPESNMTPEMEIPMQEEQMPIEESTPVGYAMGGNLFPYGGPMGKGIMQALGLHTRAEALKWLEDHNIENAMDIKNDDPSDWSWNADFISAVRGINPALADAMAEGYDFGEYKPTKNNKATIQSISKGNWKNTDGKGWKGSDDLAFIQAVEGLSEEEINALTTEQLAERMKNTEAYKNTSKWLENSDNALLYLNTLLNDANTPQVAKDYALKFVKDGKWKDGFTYDYGTVFGKDGQGVRETNPGTYWHSVAEANRGSKVRNLVINEDGTIEDILTDVPSDWISAGNFSWADANNDYAYNYYKRPVKPAEKVAETVTDGNKEEDDTVIEPILKNESARYAGILGPAVGLGMQLMGIGKPNYSGINRAVGSIGTPALVGYKPIGDYLTFRPMDIWAEQNRMDANARATDRAIMNTSSPIGTQYAGLLANAYTDQLGSGNLFSQSLQYDDNKRAQNAGFNRGTSQFNAEAYNRTSATNADILNRTEAQKAQMRMQAALQKLNMDNMWNQGFYGNAAGIFGAVSDFGKENAQHNMIAKMAADGLFGNLSDKQFIGNGFIRRTKRG